MRRQRNQDEQDRHQGKKQRRRIASDDEDEDEDEDEDGGVAEDEGVAEGVVEPSLRCVGVGGMSVGELLSRCAAVGDVGAGELSSRFAAVDVGGVDVEVGVVLDDHFHRSINGRPNGRQNERVGIRGGETLSQIPLRVHTVGLFLQPSGVEFE